MGDKLFLSEHDPPLFAHSENGGQFKTVPTYAPELKVLERKKRRGNGPVQNLLLFFYSE